MKPIDFSKITMKGELAVRCGKNFARLEDKWYRPEEVYTADMHGWPGDWPGRCILGVSLLSKSTGKKAAWLDEIVALFDTYKNETGHLGKIFPINKFDEQYYAGHSWLIRGFIEYIELTGDKGAEANLETLVKNYLLAVKGHYNTYPITMEERIAAQDSGVWNLSQKQTKLATHAGTSDAGCAFIAIDGATAAYDYFKWTELKELVEEMIERFSKMDFLGCNIQTHATLSGTRGVIRFYEITKEQKYLDLAKRIFKIYIDEACSEAYGNYNWFGLPGWTEPCAIIDSFMVATQLWQHTGEQEYLEYSQRIYFNAVSHGNRYTGAFGTDNDAGACEAVNPKFLHPRTFDVHWCCNMRGGEGLSRAVQYNVFLDKNDAYFAYYNDCTAVLDFDIGTIKVEEYSKYPYCGKVKIKVIETSVKDAVAIKLFVPSWANNAKITLNGNEIKTNSVNGFVAVESKFNEGDIIELDFDMEVRSESASFKNSLKGYHKFFYGPMLLGHKVTMLNDVVYGLCESELTDNVNIDKNAKFERVDLSRFMDVKTGVCLSALCDIRDMTKESTCRQIMFKD